MKKLLRNSLLAGTFGLSGCINNPFGPECAEVIISPSTAYTDFGVPVEFNARGGNGRYDFTLNGPSDLVHNDSGYARFTPADWQYWYASPKDVPIARVHVESCDHLKASDALIFKK